MKKSILFISFTDPALERRFLLMQYKDNLVNNRVLSFVGLLSFTAYYLMNYTIMQPDGASLYALPYLLGFAGFSLIIALTSLPVSSTVFNPLTLLGMFMVNAAPLVSLMALDYPDTLYFYCGSVLLAVIGLIFTRISLYYLVGFAALYGLAFELQLLFTGPHSRLETLNLSYLLAVGMVVGLVVAYNMEKRERINFIKLRIIVEDRMKLSRLKDAKPDDALKTKK